MHRRGRRSAGNGDTTDKHRPPRGSAPGNADTDGLLPEFPGARCSCTCDGLRGAVNDAVLAPFDGLHVIPSELGLTAYARTLPVSLAPASIVKSPCTLTSPLNLPAMRTLPPPSILPSIVISDAI